MGEEGGDSSKSNKGVGSFFSSEVPEIIAVQEREEGVRSSGLCRYP